MLLQQKLSGLRFGARASIFIASLFIGITGALFFTASASALTWDDFEAGNCYDRTHTTRNSDGSNTVNYDEVSCAQGDIPGDYCITYYDGQNNAQLGSVVNCGTGTFQRYLENLPRGTINVPQLLADDPDEFQDYNPSEDDSEGVTEEGCELNGGIWNPNNSTCGAYSPQTTNDCQGTTVDKSNCGIIRYLVMFINILSALAGIIIVGSIIAGGIQYSSAGSDPQKVQAAKNRIKGAVIALLFFLFGYAVLNYLVPGGVL